MKVVAAIPVRNQLKWTAPLVESLLIGDQIDELWLYDNGSTDFTPIWAQHRANLDSRLIYVNASEMRLYDMWNDMILTASEVGGVRLAILNNDIRLPFGAIRKMAELMDGYQMAMIEKDRSSFAGIDPNAHAKQTHWNHRVGYAFMVEADFWKGQQYAIHPDYIIWWGDDDLFRRCETGGGKICRIVGVGCDHSEWSSDPEYRGDKWRDVEIDRETYRRMWG